MSGRLHLSLKTVIKAINGIKAHALSTRLFKHLRNENDKALSACFSTPKYSKMAL